MKRLFKVLISFIINAIFAYITVFHFIHHNYFYSVISSFVFGALVITTIAVALINFLDYE
jgi:Na+/glutamate symporter